MCVVLMCLRLVLGWFWTAHGAWQPMPRSGNKEGRKETCHIRFVITKIFALGNSALTVSAAAKEADKRGLLEQV